MSWLRKDINPLVFIMIALVLTMPFDLNFYIGKQRLIAFGAVVILAKLVFLVLYFRKSPLAWHVALVITAANTPIGVLLAHLYPEATSAHSRPILEMVIVLLLCLYLWSARNPYLVYIQPTDKS